ncbi:MAG TPA: tetratricopeptide repeat protein [Polyangiaceae bacterium]|nr:tetratricopeptide repeat protein [Polyangiaceae bacterium]
MHIGRSWPQLLALVLGACPLLTASPSRAQVPVQSTPTAAETGEAGARPHFDRALELYRSGHYVEALEQLQQAAKLDPDGQDLFFNLALVHEKLGQLPQAIAALERFRELETDEAERERARLSIERLRGAEQTAEVTPRPSAACAEPSPALPPAKAPSAVLIGAGSLAVVSLVVGAVFGAKALSDDVSGARTSASLSVTELHERAQRAEREALVADIAFALSAASTATFAGVWLLSPGDPAQRAAGITLRSYF